MIWYASFAIVVVLPVPFTPTNITTKGRGLFSIRPKKSRGGTDSAFVIASRRATSTPCSRLASREIRDRKSTRLNSSHSQISYAVFCLKKKKKKRHTKLSLTTVRYTA